MVPPGHPIEATRCIACDLGEGVGRDSSCIVVRDDWGLLQVELGDGMGLPEAAEAIGRLARSCAYHTTGSRSISWGSAATSPTTWHGTASRRPFPTRGKADRKTGQAFPTYAASAGWKLRNRLDATHLEYEAHDRRKGLRGLPQAPFYFCPGAYYGRLVDELRPLTYSLVGKTTKLLPKDDWAVALGHSPDVADALIQSMIFAPGGPTVRPPLGDLPTRPTVSMGGEMLVSIPEYSEI